VTVFVIPAVWDPPGVLVVTNELAGRIERDGVATVLDVLRTVGPVEHVECHTEADLDPALDRRDGRTVVVVGGDGSLHAMLGALWRRGEAGDCLVGLIPLGTGNDFARGVGIPLQPVEAAKLIVAGTPTSVDLVTDDGGGLVVNAMHVGAGAEAAIRARPLKPLLKIVSFPIGALLAGVRAPGWRLRVEVDGRAVVSGRRRVLMAGLANAPSIAGGTALLAPGASVTDGVMDIIVSSAVGPLARAGYAVKLMRGTHSSRDDVRRLTGRTLAISGEPFHINADGEIAGPFRRRVWTLQPAAWRCILPASSPA
jgi:diacylglycerol kinase (ATP)